MLFDLSGHTAHNRLPMFARKPAPLQGTWIGYPNTTGLAAMDYVLCDPFNAPHGLYEHLYNEKFARLPSSGSFAAPSGTPAPNSLPALATGRVTFCGAFGGVAKQRLEHGIAACEQARRLFARGHQEHVLARMPAAARLGNQRKAVLLEQGLEFAGGAGGGRERQAAFAAVAEGLVLVREDRDKRGRRTEEDAARLARDQGQQRYFLVAAVDDDVRLFDANDGVQAGREGGFIGRGRHQVSGIEVGQRGERGQRVGADQAQAGAHFM